MFINKYLFSYCLFNMFLFCLFIKSLVVIDYTVHQPRYGYKQPRYGRLCSVINLFHCFFYILLFKLFNLFNLFARP